MPSPDISLKDIKAAGKGDARAQRVLVDGLMPGAYRLAYRMLNNQALAEEATQDAFLKLWRYLPDWEPRAKLSTWFYRVTLNVCQDRLRKKTEVLAEVLPDPADDKDGPAQALAKSQQAQLLHAAIAKLPERQRAAITLCGIEQMSQKEAAAILETTPTAVDSLVARAKRQLKEALTPQLRSV
ncbi:MAG: sigma-70 family RNA polymerase sigma factor [Pseudomonadota bacterium]